MEMLTSSLTTRSSIVNNTMNRVLKKRSHQAYAESSPPMAIFIHAGAGYHSIQNENSHLAMCSK